jgi:hypothetical protein
MYHHDKFGEFWTKGRLWFVFSSLKYLEKPGLIGKFIESVLGAQPMPTVWLDMELARPTRDKFSSMRTVWSEGARRPRCPDPTPRTIATLRRYREKPTAVPSTSCRPTCLCPIPSRAHHWGRYFPHRHLGPCLCSPPRRGAPFATDGPCSSATSRRSCAWDLQPCGDLPKLLLRVAQPPGAISFTRDPTPTHSKLSGAPPALALSDSPFGPPALPRAPTYGEPLSPCRPKMGSTPHRLIPRSAAPTRFIVGELIHRRRRHPVQRGSGSPVLSWGLKGQAKLGRPDTAWCAWCTLFFSIIFYSIQFKVLNF